LTAKKENLLVGIKYSMRDLTCEVINYCGWSCNTGERSVYGKIV